MEPYLTWHRYYLSVTTPFFVITNQFDRDYFAATTCSVSQEDEEYQDYEIGARGDASLPFKRFANVTLLQAGAKV